MDIKKRSKKIFDKVWHLLWKDDTWRGWIFSIVFIFIFIKFIFFPTLSLVTQTALPLAIVESCSMYHDGNFLSDSDEWWASHEVKYSPYAITKGIFEDFKFKKGFNKGDILFIIGVKPEKVKIGDVIIFNAYQRNPIIHRIVEVNKKNNGEYTFSTIGDNNNGQLNFEKSIKPDQIMGKAVFRIAPYLGWGKLIFYELKKSPSERGLCKQN